MARKKQLSILIPVYNETCYDFVKKLSAMCQAIADEGRLTDYEIIVADDASIAEDCLIANRLINDVPHCRFIEKAQNTGSAATRNYLAQQSTFDWLLFLDCDMEICDNDFLLRYLECEEDGVINGGICIGEGSATNLRYLYEKHCEPQHTAEMRMRRPYHSFRSTNFLIRRDIMIRCPFDESFKKSGYEDVMFGKQLMKEGINVCHINNPIVMNSFEDNETYMLKTERNLRTLYKYRKELTGFSKFLKVNTPVRLLMRLWHSIFGALERKNLCGSHPRLWIYNCYRLGYYLTLKG